MLYNYQLASIIKMNDFLTGEKRLYRLYWNCGFGKSYTLAKFIALHPELKFLYVTVNHAICDNFYAELLRNGVDDIIHFKGKSQPNMCIQPDDIRYYPGCKCEGNWEQYEGYQYVQKDDTSYCQYKCPYKLQNQEKRVILTTVQLMNKFAEGRIVIIDETPENEVVKQKVVHKDEVVLDQEYHHEDKFGDEHIYWTKIQLKLDFKVKDQRSYMIEQFFNSTRHNAVLCGNPTTAL